MYSKFSSICINKCEHSHYMKTFRMCVIAITRANKIIIKMEYCACISIKLDETILSKQYRLHYQNHTHTHCSTVSFVIDASGHTHTNMYTNCRLSIKFFVLNFSTNQRYTLQFSIFFFKLNTKKENRIYLPIFMFQLVEMFRFYFDFDACFSICVSSVPFQYGKILHDFLYWIDFFLLLFNARYHRACLW